MPRTAELEITAVSAATYTLVADKYRLIDPGASMGKGYGPILVAREPIDPRDIPRTRSSRSPAATPPPRSCCRMFMPEEPALIEVAFDQIPQAVRSGRRTSAYSSTKARSPTRTHGAA